MSIPSKFSTARRCVFCLVVTLMGTSNVGPAQSALDDSWTLSINGQQFTPTRRGLFHAFNISASDAFGLGGPGTRPDFLSDDYLRITGTRVNNGVTSYLITQPFQLRQGEIQVISSYAVTSVPPRAVNRLRTRPSAGSSNVLTSIDQTLQLATIGDLSDGTIGEDLTPQSKWTTYRTSNPGVALVNNDGLVTAKGRGIAFITAGNEGATSTTRIIVAPGDPLTSVEGLCQDENGAAVPNATVQVVGQNLTAISDASGFFKLEGIAATLGNITVRATAEGFAGASAATAPMDDAITDVGIIVMTVPNTAGRNFVVTFMDNIGRAATLTLFISSDVDAEGTVEIPGLAFEQSFVVEPGLVTSVTVPSNAALIGSNLPQARGIVVRADADVNLYGLNRSANTTDAYVAFPIEALGRRHRTMSYSGGFGLGGEVAVVATENATNVTIHGSPTRTLELNQYEAYQATGQDFTGVLVEADKPIAVFSGHSCANVPTNFGACDHLVEQIPPTDTWGRRVLTLPLATRLNGDTFRILADEDATTVQIVGPAPETLMLNSGQFAERILTGNNEITADKPILVAQYSNGTQFDGVISDPFMVLVPPSEQFLRGYTFTTPASGFRFNFVNVIALTADVTAGQVQLDGVPLASTQFQTVLGSEYSCAKLPIALGSHTIKAANPLGIYVYGFDSADSYGYPGGLSLQRRP